MRLVRRLAPGLAALSLLVSPTVAAPLCEGDGGVVNVTGAPALTRQQMQKHTHTVFAIILLNARPRFGDDYVIQGRGRTNVRFKIDRNGKLVSAEVAKTSGSVSFDTEAVRIVRRAGEWFPALPAGYPCATRGFVVPISFDARRR